MPLLCRYQLMRFPMKDSNKRFPELTLSVIEELEKRFPSKIPTSKNFSYEDFRYLQGQVSVVEFLRHQFTLQTQTVIMENV